MNKLLHVDSSGKGSMSVTRPLTEYFAKKWTEKNPAGRVVYRDLMDSNLQFVSPEMVGAYYTPEDKQTPEQQKLLATSNAVVAELFEADTYVWGVPMYNFTVPAVFKAYIDLFVRAGKTFSYEGGIPKGLLLNKKLVVVTASAGDYGSEPYKSLDFVEPYLRGLTTFLGITDITFVKAHGRDPEAIATATKAAQREIDGLFAQQAQRQSAGVS